MNREFCHFSGTANPALGWAFAAEFGVRLGLCTATRFPDGGRECSGFRSGRLRHPDEEARTPC